MHIMIRTLALIPPLILSACAAVQTPEGILSQSPTQVVKVKAKPEDVRDCLVLPHPGEITATPFKEGWLVIHQLDGFVGKSGTVWIVQIDKDDNGADLKIYKIGFYSNIYDAEVQPCLDRYSRHTL